MNKKLLTVLAVLLLISVLAVACRGDNAGSNEDPAQTQATQQDENPSSSEVSAESSVDVPTPAPDSDNPDLVQSDPPDPDTPSESGEEGDEVGSGNAVETSEDGTQEPVEEEGDAEPAAEPAEEAMVETTETEEADAEGSADANLHIIEDGETLSLIAAQYDVSADVLATYNEIDDVDSIVAGDVIRLPTGAIAAAIAQQIEQANAITTETASAESEPEEEETPEAVAEVEADAGDAEESENSEESEDVDNADDDAGDSADTEDNDDADDSGDNDGAADSATVEAVSEEATYTVQSGDGLAYIAIDYDVDIDDLAAANNLASYDDIKIGQVLTIPGIAGSGSDSAETSTDTETEASAAEPIYHEIVFSDKLDNIAEFYGVSMESIIEANDIEDPDLIKLGQFLLIPTE